MGTATHTKRLFDLSPVIDLHQSLSRHAPPPTLPIAPKVDARDFAIHHGTAPSTGGLGDFDRVFRALGIDGLQRTEAAAHAYKDDYASDGVTYVKSASGKRKSVQWKDKLTDEETTDVYSDSSAVASGRSGQLTKKQRKRANRRARAESKVGQSGTVSESEAGPAHRTPTPAGRAGSHHVANNTTRPLKSAEPDLLSFNLSTSVRTARDRVQEKLKEVKASDAEHATSLSTSSKVVPPSVVEASTTVRTALNLTPATIPPRPPHAGPIRPKPVKLRYEIRPLLARPNAERHMDLYLKLYNEFQEDRTALAAPINLINGNRGGPGIHVFIDASNIFIGFKDQLKRVRGIPQHIHMPDADFSFDAFALLLERRRPVARRVLVGSNPPSPAHLRADEVGYECNLLEKVWKVKGPSPRHRRLGTDPNAPSRAEQGVDEILHLKMLQSVVDYAQPSIMVVATGDAAIAEYSDGFLANIKRALSKGWKIELVSWSMNISKAYQDPAFMAYWAGQFEIIFLDDYAEELLSTQSPGAP